MHDTNTDASRRLKMSYLKSKSILCQGKLFDVVREMQVYTVCFLTLIQTVYYPHIV